MITTINEMKTKMINENMNIEQVFVPSQHQYTVGEIIEDFLEDYEEFKDADEFEDDKVVTQLGLETVVDENYMLTNLTPEICQEYINIYNNDEEKDHSDLFDERSKFKYNFFVNLGLFTPQK